MTAQVPTRFPFPVSCDACGNIHETKWYCQRCKEALCTHCKSNHPHQSHSIVTRAAFVNENISKLTARKLLCNQHKGQTCQLYCLPCDCLVCTTCVTQSHRKHEFADLPEMVYRKKSEFAGLLAELQDKRIPQYTKMSDNLTDKIHTYESQMETTCVEIRSHVSTITAAIKSYSEKYIQTLQSKQEMTLQPWNMCLSDRKKGLNSVIYEFDIFQQALKSNDILDLPEMLRQLKTKLDELQNTAFPITPLKPNVFEKTKINDDAIQQLFGPIQDKDTEYELSLRKISQEKRYSRQVEKTKERQLPPPKTEVSLRKTFDFSKKIDNPKEPALKVKVLNDKDMCISCSRSVMIAKKDGNLKARIPKTTKLQDPVLVLGNEVLLARDGQRQHVVNKIWPNGKTEVYIDVEYGQVTGLHMNRKKELLLTIFYLDDTYGEVVRVDKLGNITQRIYTEENDVFMFAHPRSITENGNNDIWVVDEELNTVEVITEKGRHKLSYGNSEILRNFQPKSVVCDSNMNALIADIGNRCIHVLDRDGRVLRYLQTYDHGITPYYLDIERDGQLWVSDHNLSKLYLLEYF